MPNIFDILFLAIPLVLLWAMYTERWPKKPLIAFLVYIPLGWLLVNASVYWHFTSLSSQAANAIKANIASDELLDRAQSDGAARVFAYYYGWLNAICYFGLCWAAVHVGFKFKKKETGGA